MGDLRPTQLSFVRLSSNPAYTPAPATPRAAAALLQQFTAHKGHQYWRTMPEPTAEIFARALGHQQVIDAYLVHLAERHDGRLVTFDRRLSTHASSATSVHVIDG